MRLDFLLNTREFSGGERYTLSIASELADRVTVRVVAAQGSRLCQEAANLGLEVLELPLGPKLGRRTVPTVIATAPRTYRSITSYRRGIRHSDHIVVLQYKLEQLLWGRRALPRYAVIEHGSIPDPLLRTPLIRTRLRRFYVGAERRFAVSGPAERSLGSLDCGEIHPLRPAWSTSPTKPVPSTAPVNFCYVGRVVENKGIFHAIRWAAEWPDASLLVVGDGADRERAENFATSMMPGRACFTGNVESPWRYAASSHVLLFFSTDPGEGFPLAVAEALGHGLQVIGLADSPAMVEMKRETLSPAIHLLPSFNPPDENARVALRSYFTEHQPAPLHSRTWSEVAEEFMCVLRAR